MLGNKRFQKKLARIRNFKMAYSFKKHPSKIYLGLQQTIEILRFYSPKRK